MLRPGEIELTVRNVGPDAGQRRAGLRQRRLRRLQPRAASEVGRLGSQTLTLDYPWQEGSPLLITLLTSTGATIEHEIEVAVETPEADAGFYGLMALLGTYVGVIPVALGMLFLPFLGRMRESWIRIFMAATIGLLGFLAVDAYLEGTEIAAGERRRLRRRRAALHRRGGRLPRAGRARPLPARPPRARHGRPARAPSSSRCWSRSGSGCTTSARASRSARPTRSASSRSAPSSSSASRSTTRPRASRSSPRSPTASDPRWAASPCSA